MALASTRQLRSQGPVSNGDGARAGAGSGVEADEGAQDGDGDGSRDGSGVGAGIRRRTQGGNGNGDGNGGAIVAGEICSESSDCLGSATVAGTVIRVQALRSSELSAQVRGSKPSTSYRSRNFKWCVEDGGRGVCSSDVHHLLQKPVSAAQMQFIDATRSIRYCTILLTQGCYQWGTRLNTM